jgi:hypothetical protein
MLERYIFIFISVSDNPLEKTVVSTLNFDSKMLIGLPGEILLELLRLDDIILSEIGLSISIL